ncbi:MAG: hypothetical protein CVV06_02710 [Gammaproteobacteria bacterium HGW-Gammaproteobacteria-10]|nr:MAG: hypothetical protein CVV06_02710 [Gammaproteobacteria bacterium HGW-Gammaproteobacteria-10]
MTLTYAPEKKLERPTCIGTLAFPPKNLNDLIASEEQKSCLSEWNAKFSTFAAYNALFQCFFKSNGRSSFSAEWKNNAVPTPRILLSSINVSTGTRQPSGPVFAIVQNCQVVIKIDFFLIRA